ncbi:MAG: SCO family protein [Bacteroidetes bacterium]|nr:SCO family protein [Bacteroidota bacterium]
MNYKKNKYAFAFLLLFFLVACTNKSGEEKKKLLPVIGIKTLSPSGDTLYHRIGSFSLLNQYKETVSEKTVHDKIYVANFFFATCQSICPAMSNQLERVQDAFKNDSGVLILSHTVNPMHDTAEVLLEYAERHHAIKNKWHFLTGSKKSLYDLAKNDYLVNAVQDDGTPEGFIHSESLLLIDTQRRIRGIYDGTDSLQVNKLMEDIQWLKTEQ